jgi:putative flippase GtrA
MYLIGKSMTVCSIVFIDIVGIMEEIAKIVVAVFVVILNYILSKLIVFRNK